MKRLGPFDLDALTGEPSYRLRNHPNIVITPPRESDIPHVVPPLNDERISIWFDGPPYPYTHEHARQWIMTLKAECDLGLKELSETSSSDAPNTLSHLPVAFLREIQEHGSDTFLGYIGIFRCPDDETRWLEDLKCGTLPNSSLPKGHPEIVWALADWLLPCRHGQGIMSDAVGSLINDLAKPLLGATNFTATVFSGNEGSQKVFLKNGFKLTRCLKNHGEVKGFMRDLNVFERVDEAK